MVAGELDRGDDPERVGGRPLVGAVIAAPVEVGRE